MAFNLVNTKVTVQKKILYCQKDFKQVILKITCRMNAKKNYSINCTYDTVNGTSELSKCFFLRSNC